MSCHKSHLVIVESIGKLSNHIVHLDDILHKRIIERMGPMNVNASYTLLVKTIY
mgnify:CR=1 FL=1